MPSSLVARLTHLVAFDTRNPEGSELPLVEKLAADLRGLGAAAVETFAAGDHHAALARFGGSPPRLLLNAHIDTVPAPPGYTASPFSLVERDGRLHGLGAADTKGAVAAILDALADPAAQAHRLDGVAVLFSGDEEREGSCVRAFLRRGLGAGIERAIVCEPTSLKVGRRHRGIGAARAVVRSPGGHSSRADRVPAPLLLLSRAAVAADRVARERYGDGQGGGDLCLNVAALDGGIAFNVIPPEAALSLSVRPAPGVDIARVLSDLQAAARAAVVPTDLEWNVLHANPSFATRDLEGFRRLLGGRVDTTTELGFWTEAALLAEHGIDAVVFGPGAIEQAHAPDEYVTVRELEAARDVFVGVLAATLS